MKKKKVLSLLLALALWVGLLTVPAGAYYVDYCDDGSSYFRVSPEDQKWWNDNSSELVLRQHYNRENIGIPPEFLDGLLLMEHLESGEPNIPYYYFDRDCNIYDLNPERKYWRMFSFSEGLAAVFDSMEGPTVADRHNQICYIDKQGNEVIRLDPSFCAVEYDYNQHNYFVGYFQDGKACVVRRTRNNRFPMGFVDPFVHERDQAIEYAYIDTTGKVVTDWTYTNDAETIARLPLYNEYGGWIGHCCSDSLRTKNAPLYADQAPEMEVPFKATHPDGTYGQAQVDFLGYTIDPENLYNGTGYIVAQVTNATPNWDEGDVFHMIYSRFSETGDIVDSATEFLPRGWIRQIHYEIEPWGVKILKIPTDYVVNEDKKLLWAGFADMNPHWTENPYVDESRTLLLQAETYAECTRLVEFFKAAHDYGEAQLTYEAHNGVTILGAPMPILRRKAYLDQELSAFTSQF